MIKSMAEISPLTWSQARAERAGVACQKCGVELWRYTGEPVKEWDMQRGVYNTHQTGETLPCWGCSQMLEDLVTQQLKLSYMQSRTNRPKGEHEPEESYRYRQERDGKIEVAQKAELMAICTEFGYTMVLVQDYINASRRKQYGEAR